MISGDRLENRIAREQVEECSKLVNQSENSKGRSNRTAQKEKSLMF